MSAVATQIVCPDWCVSTHRASDGDVGPTYAHYTEDIQVGEVPVGLTILTDADGRDVEPPTISLDHGELDFAEADALIDAIRQLKAILQRA